MALLLAVAPSGGAGAVPLANEALAQQGTLETIRPSVRWTQAATTTGQAVASRQTVQAGDRVSTGAGAYARLVYFEGSVTMVEADTELVVQRLDRSNNGNIVASLLQSVGTTVSLVTHLVDSGASFEVETPAAIVFVRGTIPRVQVAPNGVTHVRNVPDRVPSRVGVRGRDVNQTVVILEPNQETTVAPGQAPRPASTPAPTRVPQITGQQSLSPVANPGTIDPCRVPGATCNPTVPDPCQGPSVGCHPPSPDPCQSRTAGCNPPQPDPCSRLVAGCETGPADPCQRAGVVCDPVRPDSCARAVVACDPGNPDPCTLRLTATGCDPARPVPCQPRTGTNCNPSGADPCQPSTTACDPSRPSPCPRSVAACSPGNGTAVDQGPATTTPGNSTGPTVERGNTLQSSDPSRPVPSYPDSTNPGSTTPGGTTTRTGGTAGQQSAGAQSAPQGVR